MLSAMRAFVKRRQPVLCSPFVLGGANTPASVAPAVAQLITRGKVIETPDDNWVLSLAVNVEAPFRISRAAIPIMATGGGAIVNTASSWGLRPGSGHAVCCKTKAALASLTQCMGMDHSRQGFHINAV